MNRFAFACALVCCMLWFASSEAVGPGGQEKVSEPAKEGGKKEDKPKVAVKQAVLLNPVVITTKVMAAPAKAAQKDKEGGKVKAAAKVAAPAAVAAPVMFNVNLAGQQFLPQFQKLHKAELHFMRMVCQPSRQQFEAIARDGDEPLKDLAKKFATNNQNNGFIIINAGMADGDDKNDFHRQIADVVAKSARKVLTAEQANRFDRELAERREANKQCVVLGFVSKMDSLLHLTTEQREKLIKLLNAKWKYSANREQLLNLGGGQYFPVMPDVEISPILTEAQRHVWSGVQKGNMNFGVNLNEEGEEDFEEKWDEPAKKPTPKDSKSADKPSGSAKKGKS